MATGNIRATKDYRLFDNARAQCVQAQGWRLTVKGGGKMTFDQAKLQCVPFGKFKGQSIDKVASTSRGLMYLDWMMSLKDLREGPFKDALNTYMRDEGIQKEVQQAMQDREYERQQWH